MYMHTSINTPYIINNEYTLDHKPRTLIGSMSSTIQRIHENLYPNLNPAAWPNLNPAAWPNLNPADWLYVINHTTNTRKPKP